MMTRSRIMLFIAVAGIVAIAGGAALAQPGGGMRAGDPQGEVGCRLEWLDLTDGQKAEIEKLREEAHEARPEAEKRMRRLEHELHGEMLKDDPDAENMRDLVRKIGQLRTERQLSHLNLRLAIREQLTPEQRDRLLLHGPAGPGAHHGCGHGRGMGAEMGCAPGCGMHMPGHRGHGMQGPGSMGHGKHGAAQRGCGAAQAAPRGCGHRSK